LSARLKRLAYEHVLFVTHLRATSPKGKSAGNVIRQSVASTVVAEFSAWLPALENLRHAFIAQPAIMRIYTSRGAAFWRRWRALVARHLACDLLRDKPRASENM